MTQALYTLPLGENTNNIRRQRIEWIDTARGLGIILVVYGHVLRGLVASGVLQPLNPLRQTDYIIYTFHMPLFFFLAGLNVDRSISKGRDRFLQTKLSTIAYPYLIWSMIQGSVQHFMHIYVNSPRSSTFFIHILWQPIGQFWFLYVLFLCHIFALLLAHNRAILAGSGILSYGLCLVVSSPFWNPILYMFPFYVAGIFLGKSLQNVKPARTAALVATLLWSVLFAFSVHLGRIASRETVVSLFTLPATVSGIALFCVSSQLIVRVNLCLTRVLRTLGIMSMTIYILHVLAAAGARVVSTRLGLHSWIGELSLGVLLGLGLPMLAQVILARLHLLTVFGLAPVPLQEPALQSRR